MTTTAIEVKSLTKSYGKTEVLHGISFTIQQGEIFALLGVNGAGKTTALECMEGLRRYEQGEIKIKGGIGIQLQSSSLPKNIKGKEALRFFSKWKHVQPDEKNLRAVGADALLNKQYGDMSTGQKRRLHLALSMLGDPDILFLDEPTAGLDVEGRAALHDELRRLKKQGKTIVLASHDMPEVEQLCDRTAILKDGKIEAFGSPAELVQEFQRGFLLQLRFSSPPELQGLTNSRYISQERGYWTFETEDLAGALEEAAVLSKRQGISIRDVRLKQESLEDRFLAIAKEGN